MENKASIELIKHFESCRLNAYQDSVGVWTIGYGHTFLARKGMAITQSQADDFLNTDLQVKRDELAPLLKDVDLSENQYGAILSFTFNLGVGNFKSSTLYKKIKEDPDDVTIGVEFPRWHRAGGKRLRGLMLRRLEEAKLYFTK